jgi:hypothetical protein
VVNLETPAAEELRHRYQTSYRKDKLARDKSQDMSDENSLESRFFGEMVITD